MNAVLSVPAREDEVESKVRKVRAFGRKARIVTLVMGVIVFIGLAMLLVVLIYDFGRAGTDVGGVAPGGRIGGRTYVLRALLTPQQFAVTMSLMIVVSGAISLAFFRQLYRLFTNLAAGEIYTPGNVGCLRNLGLLLLLGAVLGVVIPTAVVVARGLLDASVPIDVDLIYPSLDQLFWSFATAGLVLLASWIMDIGLCVKNQADALQRDAELTI